MNLDEEAGRFQACHASLTHSDIFFQAFPLRLVHWLVSGSAATGSFGVGSSILFGHFSSLSKEGGWEDVRLPVVCAKTHQITIHLNLIQWYYLSFYRALALGSPLLRRAWYVRA